MPGASGLGPLPLGIAACEMLANLSRTNSTGLRMFSSLFVVVNAVQSLNVLLIGSLGNAMVIAVIARRSVLNSPTNVYLLSLAAADLLILNLAIVPNLIHLNSPINHWLLGPVLCPVLVSLQYYICNTSAIFITLFSHERWVAICYPMKARLTSNVGRVRLVVWTTWVVSLLYHSMWLYLSRSELVGTRRPGFRSCTFRLDRSSYRLVYTVDAALFYFVPLVLICGFYSHIGYALYFRDSVSSQTLRKVRASKIQIIKMLFLVSILFGIFCLPYRVLVVYNSFADKKYMDFWFLLFSKNMMFMNSAINPILYNVMSRNFRLAFKNLVVEIFLGKKYLVEKGLLRSFSLMSRVTMFPINLDQ